MVEKSPGHARLTLSMNENLKKIERYHYKIVLCVDGGARVELVDDQINDMEGWK